MCVCVCGACAKEWRPNMVVESEVGIGQRTLPFGNGLRGREWLEGSRSNCFGFRH